MPLLSVMLTLIVAGVLLYLANRYIPMDSKVKSILNAAVIIILILWLLNLFGVFTSISGIRVGGAR